jgi:hypothetical protein
MQMRIVAWVLPLVMVFAPAAQAGLCKCGEAAPVEGAPSCCGGASDTAGAAAAPPPCNCGCSHDDGDKARSGCGCSVQPQATTDALDDDLSGESTTAPVLASPACDRALTLRAFRMSGEAPPSFLQPLLI